VQRGNSCLWVLADWKECEKFKGKSHQTNKLTLLGYAARAC